MVILKSAVRQTRKYAAFFHTVLDDSSLHHWLISEKVVSKNKLSSYFQKLTPSQVGEIKKRKEVSDKKIHKAKQVVRFLSLFPTISLVAITGSLAIDNAKENDDIDLMLITKKNTLWLTRLFVIPFLSVFFPRRHPATNSFLPDAVCPNLWLDDSALAIPANKRNLYTAHEVLQALPLFDRGGVYLGFLTANHWTSDYLANAYKIALEGEGTAEQISRAERSRFATAKSVVRARRNFVPRALVTPNRIIKTLNLLAFKLQYLYMKKKITHETVTLHSAYFHPRDLSPKLNQHLGLY